MTNDLERNGDTTPFPSNAEMDLDLWRASTIVTADHSRTVSGVGEEEICKVYGAAHHDPERDVTARRIEMMGEVYEELRLLADRAKAAGLDVTTAESLLSDFIAPKPFSESD